MTFIPEEEYQKILKTMPVFCGDLLIFAEKKYLLIKRKEEPVKDVYWVIGGRLRFKETMAELAERVMMQEIGREPIKQYMPQHPAADPQGYIYKAAVNVDEEMVDMLEASRQYQNNVEVISTLRALTMRTINSGK